MRLVIKKSECKNENNKKEALPVFKSGLLYKYGKQCVIVRLTPGQITENPIGASRIDSQIINDITNGAGPLF